MNAFQRIARINLRLLLFLFAATGEAQAQQRGESLADIFAASGVAGTLVVSSLDGHERFVHNDTRSVERFSPASTFKIVNTLIALDRGLVTSRDSVFPWDGIEREVAAWNGDQTLASAFAVSCVWCYQQIARAVGASAYREQLAAIGYGNGQVGDAVDSFWLDGTLGISAAEQIEIIRGIVGYSLPYKRQHVDELKSIMLVEETGEYRLYAKTGWTGAGLATGWLVGYLETAGGTWLLAMNMTMDRVSPAPLREELVMRSLRALGII